MLHRFLFYPTNSIDTYHWLLLAGHWLYLLAVSDIKCRDVFHDVRLLSRYNLHYVVKTFVNLHGLPVLALCYYEAGAYIFVSLHFVFHLSFLIMYQSRCFRLSLRIQ